MLRIGMTQYNYTVPYGFETGVAKMKLQGYDCMNYEEFVKTDTELFQMNNSQFTKYLQNQAAICKREGIEIHMSHGPWRYPPRDASVEERNERFEKMARSVEGCAILGCEKMVIHPLMPFTINDEGHEKETYDINLDFMGKLTRVGREYGITICFENMPMPTLSIASVPAVLKLVKEIDDDYFKVCLDTGHSAITKNAPGDAVRMIGKDYLQALHIHDNNGKHDIHNQPYDGVIDWEDFCAALREISFDGVFNLEVKAQNKLPMELRASEEMNLFRKTAYLAQLASGNR